MHCLITQGFCPMRPILMWLIWENMLYFINIPMLSAKATSLQVQFDFLDLKIQHDIVSRDSGFCQQLSNICMLKSSILFCYLFMASVFATINGFICFYLSTKLTLTYMLSLLQFFEFCLCRLRIGILSTNFTEIQLIISLLFLIPPLIVSCLSFLIGFSSLVLNFLALLTSQGLSFFSSLLYLIPN